MNTHFLNKRFALALGFAGLIPFALFMLASWYVPPDWIGVFMRGQLAYSIAILSFLGGIHWGGALVSDHLSIDQTKKVLLWGVVPTIISLFATTVGGFGFAVLMAGFIGAYQADKHVFPWYGLPDWFLRMRFILTCAVVALLALTVIAGNVRG
ncbi:MAG: DUF3429 domain-containing protein [Burkholderiaceae bacterium]